MNREFIDYYDDSKKKTDVLPNGSEYDFLLERNKNYMNNIALTFDNGKRKITYEEMHERIDEFARALYKRGVREGMLVGVCVANTPESIYLLYALSKLGAITVGLSPLNNEYKMARDLELVKPSMVISVDMLYPSIKNACDTLNIEPILYSPVASMENPLVRLLYDGKQFISGNKFINSQRRLSSILRKGKNYECEFPEYKSGSLSDIMFTGGSSGVHKGVDLDGNGLNCVVQAIDYVLDLQPGEKLLGNVPFGHMAYGKLIMHYSLCNNLEYDLTLNALPKDFLQELIRTQANGAMGGPVHWEAIIDNPMLKKGDLSNLRMAMSGGEQLKPEKERQINEALKFGGAKNPVGNGLGLTEMWAPTHVNVGGKNTPGSIGYELPYVRSKVVDPNTFEEVPTGEIGLLVMNGPGMMLGYHNNEEETNKVITYDEEGNRWYNSMDLVRKTEDNEFNFVGRMKRNFVSGVDNIYPEQIETLLLQIPNIREVIVTPIPDENEQFLPKYHISLYNDQIDYNELENNINNLISKTLGTSALPGYIEYTIEPLPRTDNGKLNATLLANQDLEGLKSAQTLKKLR